jgi:hypothetical protein
LKKPVVLDEDGQPVEDDDDDDPDVKPDFAKYLKVDEIFPGSSVVIDGNDKALTNRVMELTEEEILGTHYNAADMKRRLLAYRKANNSKVAEPSV